MTFAPPVGPLKPITSPILITVLKEVVVLQ